MEYTRGRCSNLDYCSLADARKDIEVPVNRDFVCPECGKALKAPPIAASAGSSYLVPGLIGAGVLVVAGGAAFLGMQMGSSSPRPAPVPATLAPPASHPAAAPAQNAASAAPAPEDTLMRINATPLLAGYGARLAAAYLNQAGDTDVRIIPGAGQIKVTGSRTGRTEAILIVSKGLDAGLDNLAHGSDLVISPRRIDRSEQASLAPLGDMTSPLAEHAAGMDAAAVVVSPSNGLASIRRDQLQSVLTGAIRDWSQLGAAPAPITLYVPDPVADGAQAILGPVLAGSPLTQAARRRGVDEVAAAVAADPRGLGMTDLAHMQGARAVPVAEIGAAPVSPANAAAVASEDYPLGFRIYLYNAPSASKGIAGRVADFAASPAGQQVLQDSGLVSRSLHAAAAAPPPPATPADRLRQLVGAKAKRLGIYFTFQPNSTQLDLRSVRDLDRVLNYITSNHYAPSQVMLIGFADNQGDPQSNQAVSQKRAEAVAALFVQRSLQPGKVAGFGSDLPIADNDTEAGRERNRRVEVYIAP